MSATAPRYHRVFVSPHPDDAVFSAGGLIALSARAGMRVAVVTVFSGGPDEEVRAREDRAAIAGLGAERVDLGLPDVVARRPGARRPPSLLAVDRALIAEVTSRLAGLGDEVVGPLGVANHADHQAVFAACAALPGRVAFYEDVPYALAPGESARRLADLRAGAVLPRSLGERLAVARWWLARPALRRLAPLPLLPLAAWQAAAAIPPSLLGPLSLREERHEVAAVMDEKLAAIAAYQSQWPMFFGTLEALAAALLAHAGRLGSASPVERLFVR